MRPQRPTRGDPRRMTAVLGVLCYIYAREMCGSFNMAINDASCIALWHIATPPVIPVALSRNCHLRVELRSRSPPLNLSTMIMMN